MHGAQRARGRRARARACDAAPPSATSLLERRRGSSSAARHLGERAGAHGGRERLGDGLRRRPRSRRSRGDLARSSRAPCPRRARGGERAICRSRSDVSLSILGRDLVAPSPRRRPRPARRARPRSAGTGVSSSMTARSASGGSLQAAEQLVGGRADARSPRASAVARARRASSARSTSSMPCHRLARRRRWRTRRRAPRRASPRRAACSASAMRWPRGRARPPPARRRVGDPVARRRRPRRSACHATAAAATRGAISSSGAAVRSMPARPSSVEARSVTSMTASRLTPACFSTARSPPASLRLVRVAGDAREERQRPRRP